MIITKPQIIRVVPYLLILGLFAFVFFDKCGKGKDNGVIQKPNDTVIVTTQVPQPVVQVPATTPAPNIIVVPGQPGSTITLPQQYQQPSKDIEELTKQVKELASLLYTSKVYRDSTVLRDSTGQRVGVFNYNDSVSQNAILKRQPSYQLSFPHTYTTITKYEPYTPQRKMYVGLGLELTKLNPVNQFKAGGLYVDRKDRAYQAMIGSDKNLNLSLEVSRFFKVRLRR